MLDLYNIKSIVATQLDYRLKKKLQSKYSKINVTTEKTDKTPAFPNVFITEENKREVGRDMENLTINAIESYMHIVVSTNTTQGDCDVVSNAVTEIMKRLRYTQTSSDYIKINNVQYMNLHFRRTICPGDSF